MKAIIGAAVLSAGVSTGLTYTVTRDKPDEPVVPDVNPCIEGPLAEDLGTLPPGTYTMARLFFPSGRVLGVTIPRDSNEGFTVTDITGGYTDESAWSQGWTRMAQENGGGWVNLRLTDQHDLDRMSMVWNDSTPTADLTTTNTNPGDPLYGIPDGVVNGADTSFFVETWIGAKD